MEQRNIVADKASCTQSLNEQLKKQQDVSIFTPIKLKKNESEWERNFNQATRDLTSRAVSTIRQPIESFFNWLNEKTDIQRASKVRSHQGLIVHVFGKIATALALNIF